MRVVYWLKGGPLDGSIGGPPPPPASSPRRFPTGLPPPPASPPPPVISHPCHYPPPPGPPPPPALPPPRVHQIFLPGPFPPANFPSGRPIHAQPKRQKEAKRRPRMSCFIEKWNPPLLTDTQTKDKVVKQASNRIFHSSIVHVFSCMAGSPLRIDYGKSHGDVIR